MYTQLFSTLQLDETHLKPYVGSDLQGFNAVVTKPWGYVEMTITLGEAETAISIKV